MSALSILLAPAIALGAETTVTLIEVNGPLEEADARQALRRHALELGRCARRHLPATPEPLSATVTLTARRGAVIGDSVSMVGTAASPGLRQCIEPKLRLWRFDFAFQETTIAFELEHAASPAPPQPAQPAGPLALPVGPAPSQSALAEVAAQLKAQQRLLTLDDDLLALLRKEDLCASAADEFAAARCAETAEERVLAAQEALAGGWLYVYGLEGTLGTWSAESTQFPLTVDPVLITGGLESPGDPTLTVGRPSVRYDIDRSGGFELALPALPPLQSAALPLDEAESLAHRTQRRLEGAALVRLMDAYSMPVKTAAWYEAQVDPLTWQQKLARGEARDTDRYVTLYGIDVEVIAMEFLDPQTGAPVAFWADPAVNLDALRGNN